MKNFFQGIKVEHLKHISIVYPVILESIKLMVHEHYDTPEYDDTLFLINTISVDINLSSSEFSHSRCIYYNFEHSSDFSLEDKRKAEQFLKNNKVTEVWSMEPNCELLDTELGVKYMPVRYTSYIKKQTISKPKKFDLAFVGIIGSNGYSPRRNDFFNTYIRTPENDFSIKTLNGYPISEMQDEFANCKFIFDSHRNYIHSMQNQVRLFEHICMGHTVLSEKSDYNIFPGLIYEWNDISELTELIHTVEPQDFSEKYKEMTYTDEAYENYRQQILNDNYNKLTLDYFYKDGLFRYDVINSLIDKFNYKTYLEIGVSDGECLYNIKPNGGCWKVGVDQDPKSKATCHLTSDEFFNVLDNNGFGEIKSDFKFDIIFIDGLHLWEQCYKDINNALKHLSPNGIIICRGMNPLHEMYQSRKENIFIWNGDVWKAFVKLRSERSDLYTCMIEDCDFGLGVITWGNQEPIKLDKPIDELSYTEDFCKNKTYLMNTTTINKFIEYNTL